MVLSCHRCGADLPGDNLRGFCAQCGAPQLVLGQQIAEEAEAQPETTGAAPPPRLERVQWRLALRQAVLVAGAATVLFLLSSALPVLLLLSALAMLTAASTTVQLYRRSAPAAPMDAGIGAQIGISTGVLLLGMMAVAMAAMGVVARFRLHAMGQVDAQWAAQMAMLVDRLKAAGAGAGTSMNEQIAEMHRPEFRAWMMLGGMSLLGVVLLLISAGSGAISGAMGKLRRP